MSRFLCVEFEQLLTRIVGSNGYGFGSAEADATAATRDAERPVSPIYTEPRRAEFDRLSGHSPVPGPKSPTSEHTPLVRARARTHFSEVRPPASLDPWPFKY